MNSQQQQFIGNTWVELKTDGNFDASKCQLVLAFGSRNLIAEPGIYSDLRALYKNANILFSSTSGEIMNDQVYDETVAVTAMEFLKTTTKCHVLRLSENRNSFETGSDLMESLLADDLAFVFVISDGTKINGSELVAGFNSKNPDKIPISGGLAGDADRFVQTYTGLNGVPTEGNVIAVGFYGNNLQVGHGSVGGWDEFGHERTITRSEKNVLYEIDNKSALSLYKEYLGDYVNELPGSALLFPLSLKETGSDTTLVRTILAIDESQSSMTFAGNMPEGNKVRLMKANFDRLIEGSTDAARFSFAGLTGQRPDLAILISCVGRKLILQHRIDEEIEAAREIFGAEVPMTGFYSYGEISPFNSLARCELHNQTMTITTLKEI